MKRQVVKTQEDLDRLEAIVTTSADATTQRLHAVLSSSRGLAALAQLKFSRSGCDPLDPTRPLNLIEQLNQSFTYLASIAATRWLLARHPEHTPFLLNLGTADGIDIVSEDGEIVAETFAATDPESNDKLRKDMNRVRETGARHRYVFFLGPKAANRSSVEGVTVVQLDHSSIASLLSLPSENVGALPPSESANRNEDELEALAETIPGRWLVED